MYITYGELCLVPRPQSVRFESRGPSENLGALLNASSDYVTENELPWVKNTQELGNEDPRLTSRIGNVILVPITVLASIARRLRELSEDENGEMKFHANPFNNLCVKKNGRKR